MRIAKTPYRDISMHVTFLVSRHLKPQTQVTMVTSRWLVERRRQVLPDSINRRQKKLFWGQQK